MIYIDKLVFASHNQGKILEIKELLEGYDVEVYSAGELGLPDVEETGTTFEENARLKAETLSRLSQMPCLADDSGLCVNVLNGRPGVYSARYAPDRNFDKGMDMLLDEIEKSESKDRSAYFECVLALAMPNEETRIFEGRVDGRIALEKSGSKGFGYDPVFIPNGFEKSFAEFTSAEKGKVSHRGQALRLFVESCFLNE